MNDVSIYTEKRTNKNPHVGIKRLDDFLKIYPENFVKLVAEMVGLNACFNFWVDCCSQPGEGIRDEGGYF